MKKKILNSIRFAIFIEAGIATMLYVLYVPHRYFGNCNITGQEGTSGSFYDILCPTPTFADTPHPAFYIAIDLLIATAVLYVLYTGYIYISQNKS